MGRVPFGGVAMAGDRNIAARRVGVATRRYPRPMADPRPRDITLRRTLPGDLAMLCGFQLDPESNRLAGTKPRDPAAYHAHWEGVLRDAGVTPRVIIADGVLVGSIDKFVRGGADFIGYWIAREHWGRGIATRAVALMIREVGARPLRARVASHNIASLRALERNGFVAVSRAHDAETDRIVAGESISLELA